MKEITISFSIIFLSKHNVAPLYWSLPPSVPCQRFRQIMVLRGHSLISLLFSLVKEYGFRMNLEILILHFKNKNYFNVSLKQFDFEILQLLGYFLSWKRDYLLLCLEMRSSVKIHHEVTFIGFQSEGLEKKLEVLFKKNLPLFEHSSLSAWIIMSSLFLMSWILWKKYSLHFESIVYCSRLLACLIRKDFYRHVT